MTKQRSVRQRGQALIETALFITLLFFLTSAAVDIGLMYFAYQAIANAALEGTTYGAIEPKVFTCSNPSDPSTCLFDSSASDANLRLRVRAEPGPSVLSPENRRVEVVNIQDLNSDGVKDNNTTAPTINDLININYVVNAYGQALGTVDNAYCAAERARAVCEVQVRVTFTYRPFFPLAPTLGAKQVTIRVTRSQTIY